MIISNALARISSGIVASEIFFFSIACIGKGGT
jgi:hypothetical protein